MNACALNSDFGVPDNFLGQQQAQEGLGYIATGLWAYSAQLEMNPIWSEMFYPLIEGMTYEVVFYISLSDVSWYATKNAGVYFSINPPPSDINSLLNCTPQIRYEADEYLDDKADWTRISGSFIAQGGEKYMTIGNFDGHSGSEAIFVGGPQPPSGQPDYYKAAIYYIDDVSVTADSTTSIHEGTLGSISIYPNPVKDMLHIEGGRFEQLSLYDMQGREMLNLVLSQGERNWSMDVSHLPQGIYLLQVYDTEGLNCRGRLQSTLFGLKLGKSAIRNALVADLFGNL